MSPEDLDVLVYGTPEAARQAQIDSSLDGLVAIARGKLAEGFSVDLVGRGLEAAFGANPEWNGDRAEVGLAHAVARLAALPDQDNTASAPGRTARIQQWLVTDPLGLGHTFEDEILAVRALLGGLYNPGQTVALTTPDGRRFEVTWARPA